MIAKRCENIEIENIQNKFNKSKIYMALFATNYFSEDQCLDAFSEYNEYFDFLSDKYGVKDANVHFTTKIITGEEIINSQSFIIDFDTYNLKKYYYLTSMYRNIVLDMSSFKEFNKEFLQKYIEYNILYEKELIYISRKLKTKIEINFSRNVYYKNDLDVYKGQEFFLNDEEFEEMITKHVSLISLRTIYINLKKYCDEDIFAYIYNMMKEVQKKYNLYFKGYNTWKIDFVNKKIYKE